MKKLGYTNRFKVVLDLIFNPKKFEGTLYKMLEEKEALMQSNFNEKIDMLSYDYMVKGITKNKNSFPVIQLPIRGIERGMLDTQGGFQIETRDVSPIQLSFSCDGVTVEEIKHHAAKTLADKLINDGYLTTDIQGNNIRFSINSFT